MIVDFGAMSPPLKKQIKGLVCASMFQASADAIMWLNLHGILTDVEMSRARIRLLKSIEKAMKK